MENVLKPSAQLLCKLGSIIVHADEATGSGAHEVDITALRSLLEDEDVIEWLKEMGKMALVPVKRS
jgi:hypothetical protein